MKVVFMGTPEFAVPSLRVLLENNHDVIAVITQPDKPKGRGHKLAAPPVKELAVSKGIAVYQPKRIKDREFVDILKALAPDIIVVVAFGQLLSKEILDIPHFGCINVHASLLPKYRGAAPINWSIINGDKLTGITTMFMDIGLDTGDMILKKEIEIIDEYTAEELHDRLSELGAEVLSDTIKLIEEKRTPRTVQDAAASTYAPMLTKALGKVDWSKSATSIRNLIRGVTPWPGAYTDYNGKVMKIFCTEVMENNSINDDYGMIFDITKDSIMVKCGSGSISIKELQFENEKRMSVESYMRGHNLDKGTILI